MILQHEFDALADQLVTDGKLVSYSALQGELLKRQGHGTSDREIQKPLSDWKRRRRYKGHLAVLDLPEEMEKAIAAFTITAMKVAEARAHAAFPVTEGQGTTAGLLEQMQRIVTGLERQLAALADDNRSLQQQVAELLPPAPAPAPAPAVAEGLSPRQPVRSGYRRKSGAPAIAAKAFWDRVVCDLAKRIWILGRPMSVSELLLEVPKDVKDFAAIAFQALDRKALANKLEQRIDGTKFGIFSLDGGFYSVIPLSPGYGPLEASDIAA
ncbi:hypothetical protein [Methylobacterium sp. Leaf102]|uniref:hypothetical protein n=1 Tax=Methylobacterium sp. Leaf102 TaxID=1736253 RepID=UPI000AF3BE10|nr:hypothetical protein [Methylobacterium sp. Leaf102]